MSVNNAIQWQETAAVSFGQTAKKTAGKDSANQGFQQLLNQLFKAQSLSLTNNASANNKQEALQSKTADLFLKLKELAAEWQRRPQMSKEEKQQLVGQLRIREDLKSLGDLTLGEKTRLLEWLKQQVAKQKPETAKSSSETDKVMAEIVCFLQANQVVATSNPPSLITPAVQQKSQEVKPAGIAAGPTFAQTVLDKNQAGKNSFEQSVLLGLQNLLETDGKEQQNFSLKTSMSATLPASSGLKTETVKVRDNKQESSTLDVKKQGRVGEETSAYKLTGAEKPLVLPEKIVLPPPKTEALTIPAKEKAPAKILDKEKAASPSVAAKEPLLFINKLESDNNNNSATLFKETSSVHNSTQVDPTKVVEQVVRKIKMEIAPGVSRVEMQLEPKHLGKVQVNIVVEDNHLSARLTTDNALAKDVLQQNLTQLKEALQMQGVQVESLNVVLGNGSEGRRQFASSGDTSNSVNGQAGELDAEQDVDELTARNPQIINARMVNYLV